MTVPLPRRLFKKPGRYSGDNDEAARRRARAINQIGEAYKAGGAYDDIDNRRDASDIFDAGKDYDMLKRVRPTRSLKQTRLPKKKG